MKIKQVEIFSYHYERGSIFEQVKYDLNNFLWELDSHKAEYEIKYIPTRKGFIVVVEHFEYLENNDCEVN